MGRIQRTWQIMRLSWDILRNNPSLAMFPVLAFSCFLVSMIAFAIPVSTLSGQSIGSTFHALYEMNLTPQGESDSQTLFLYGVAIFAFYFVTTLIGTFFTAAFVVSVSNYMNGQAATFRDGLKAASSHLAKIATWSLISATVGLLLRLSEHVLKRSRLQWGEAIAAAIVLLIGIPWVMATYFLVPIMILRNEGPLTAMKESARLLKNSWAEQLLSSVGFGTVSMLLILIGILVSLPFLLILLPTLALGGLFVFIVLIMIYGFGVSLITGTCESIFQVVLYRHLTEEPILPEFRPILADLPVSSK